jgi:hypothetical protein
MITPAAIPQKPHSVRAPFRVLAGLFCLTVAFGVLGIAYLVWQRGQSVPADFIVWLPGTAWFTRLAFHAAVHGTAPKNDAHWPFASDGVLKCYLLIAILYSATTAH